MKAAALLLAGSMALAACASDEDAGGGNAASGDSSAAGGDLQIGLAYDTAGRGDKSFNDSAYAGVEAAIKDLGGEVTELSPNADGDRKSVVSGKSVDLGGRRIIKKKTVL